MLRIGSRDVVSLPLLFFLIAMPAPASAEVGSSIVESALAEQRDPVAGETPAEPEQPAPPEPEQPAPRKDMHPALMVLMLEGVIVANAGLATWSPDIYGGLAIVLAPFTFGFCDDCSTPVAVVGGIGLGGIGAYNLTLDENELDSGEIFTRNIVAWHVVAAAVGITYLISHDRSSDASEKEKEGKKGTGTFAVFPVRRGVGASYRYRF